MSDKPQVLTDWGRVVLDKICDQVNDAMASKNVVTPDEVIEACAATTVLVQLIAQIHFNRLADSTEDGKVKE